MKTVTSIMFEIQIHYSVLYEEWSSQKTKESNLKFLYFLLFLKAA